MSERDFYAEALEELDRMDGTLRPEFVDVPDGFYAQQLVIRADAPPIKVGWVTEGSAVPEFEDRYELIPCNIPRVRSELRWVR